MNEFKRVSPEEIRKLAISPNSDTRIALLNALESAKTLEQLEREWVSRITDVPHSMEEYLKFHDDIEKIGDKMIEKIKKLCDIADWCAELVNNDETRNEITDLIYGEQEPPVHTYEPRAIPE